MKKVMKFGYVFYRKNGEPITRWIDANSCCNVRYVLREILNDAFCGHKIENVKITKLS